MGRPRKIIIIRHAQSEGNQNRQIHQTVPDHRVKLTEEGWNQAQDAGRRLRDLLEPDDTLQFYTSPYRRTRETTDGILQTLTGDDPEPSPFSRQNIKVWEEPRLREQDFGNFQPGQQAMEQMWKDRAEYGHFFYRIPNGESAADAYDRVSGFNETLFRSFQEDDFPSVCVLVTHGLMSRVFLMRWYHWSVEYFEDLRNINHCELVIMNRSRDNGKFNLQNQLRTWTELKRQRDAERSKEAKAAVQPPIENVPARRLWNARRQESLPVEDGSQLRPSGALSRLASTASQQASFTNREKQPGLWRDSRERDSAQEDADDEEAFPNPRWSTEEESKAATSDTNLEPPEETGTNKQAQHEELADRLNVSSIDRPIRYLLHPDAGKSFRGSASGQSTPAEPDTSQSQGTYFGDSSQQVPSPSNDRKQSESSSGRDRNFSPSSQDRKRWEDESGMGRDVQTERLGDTKRKSDSDGGDISDQERQDKSLSSSVY